MSHADFVDAVERHIVEELDWDSAARIAFGPKDVMAAYQLALDLAERWEYDSHELVTKVVPVVLDDGSVGGYHLVVGRIHYERDPRGWFGEDIPDDVTLDATDRSADPLRRPDDESALSDYDPARS